MIGSIPRSHQKRSTSQSSGVLSELQCPPRDAKLCCLLKTRGVLTFLNLVDRIKCYDSGKDRSIVYAMYQRIILPKTSMKSESHLSVSSIPPPGPPCR